MLRYQILRYFCTHFFGIIQFITLLTFNSNKNNNSDTSKKWKQFVCNNCTECELGKNDMIFINTGYQHE